MNNQTMNNELNLVEKQKIIIDRYFEITNQSLRVCPKCKQAKTDEEIKDSELEIDTINRITKNSLLTFNYFFNWCPSCITKDDFLSVVHSIDYDCSKCTINNFNLFHECESNEYYVIHDIGESKLFECMKCNQYFSDGIFCVTCDYSLCKRCMKLNYYFPIDNTNLFNKEELCYWSKMSRPVISKKIKDLIQSFYEYKVIHGTPQEKNCYSNLTLNDCINRLIKLRPLTFYGEKDHWKLRNGEMGTGDWELIGTEESRPELSIDEYLTYDELQIGSMLSISTNTPFINDGNRYNGGKVMYNRPFPEGWYVAQVGSRFEKKNKMEYLHMIIEEQPKRIVAEKAWTDFYEIDHFPDYREAVLDETGRFQRVQHNFFFDTLIYKKRTSYLAKVFLDEANDRGRQTSKKAFCHIVGLGLGVWMIDELQISIMVNVYLDLIYKNKYKHIGVLYFAWLTPPEWFPTKINGIQIVFGKREPAERLPKEYTLVAQYAWDSNAYPGNEFWIDNLTASGDPAAASCSLLYYLQNPDYNHYIDSEFLKVFN